MIRSVFIMPHPPLMVPGIGDAGEIKDTIRAARKAADEIALTKPETVIVITPHAPSFRDFLYLSKSQVLKGSFSNFGRPDINFTFENDITFVEELINVSAQEKLSIGTLDDKKLSKYGIVDVLDHGSMVPLYFIQEKLQGFKIVIVPIAGFSYSHLYKTGECIKKASEKAGVDSVVIASADLSHKLKEDGPYGYSKEGPLFDRLVVEYISNNNIDGLINMDDKLVKKAAMCGLPSIVTGYGCLAGCTLESEVFSYQGPYGVGYTVCKIIPTNNINTATEMSVKGRIK